MRDGWLPTAKDDATLCDQHKAATVAHVQAEQAARERDERNRAEQAAKAKSDHDAQIKAEKAVQQAAG